MCILNDFDDIMNSCIPILLMSGHQSPQQINGFTVPMMNEELIKTKFPKKLSKNR